MFDVTGGARQSPNLLISALDAAEALDDLEAQARALQLLLNHHSFRAERGKALEAATRLLHVTGRIGDIVLGRNADRLMGIALLLLGRPREAQGQHLEANPQPLGNPLFTIQSKSIPL